MKLDSGSFGGPIFSIVGSMGSPNASAHRDRRGHWSRIGGVAWI